MKMGKIKDYVFFITLIIPTALSSAVQKPALAVTDQVVITASVEPKPSDVKFLFEASNTNDVLLDQGDEVEFRIKYRSLLPSAKPLLMEAEWEKGLIENSKFNYVNVFEYVTSSAATSSNGTIPTINLQNHRITWDIPSLAPSTADNTVTFKLRVRSDLPTERKIQAFIKVRSRIANTSIPERQIELFIQKGSRSAPITTSTPTPLPSPSPASASPVVKKPLRFNFVTLREATDTSAVILFKTSQETSFTFFYGESPESLSQRVQGLTLQQSHLVKITNLSPNRQYYFKIQTVDGGNQTITSDIFTFKTAWGEEIISIDKGDVTLTWTKVILTSKDTDYLVIPKEKPLAISIKIDEPKKISQITTRFKNAQVLGINNRIPLPPIEETKLIEILPGVFSGELLSPHLKGQYYVVLEITNPLGGFTTKILPFQIFVSDPLRVIDQNTKAPVENASLKVQKYEPTLKKFSTWADRFSLPYHTNEQGELDLVFPSGKYLFEITAIGYKTLKQNLELGISTFSYPTIYLEPSLSLQDRFRYYQSALTDITHFLSSQTRTFFSSGRTSDLFLSVIAITIIFLAFITLSLRMRTGILGLCSYFGEMVWEKLKSLSGLGQKKKHFYLSEQNNYHRSISGVLVYLLNNNNRIIAKTKTNLAGRAQVPLRLINEESFPLKIMVYRRGYYTYPVIIDKQSFGQDPINILMLKDKSGLTSFSGFIEWLSDLFLVLLSDFLVFLTLLFTLFFTKYQGIGRSLPLISSSLIVLILWLVYVHKVWRLLPKNR